MSQAEPCGAKDRSWGARLKLGLAGAPVATALVLAGAAPASAQQPDQQGHPSAAAARTSPLQSVAFGSSGTRVAPNGRCGAYLDGWYRVYTHCTNDGSSVQVLARYVFHKNRIWCIGANQTWRISVESSYSFEWNGQTCSNPGTWWYESP